MDEQKEVPICLRIVGEVVRSGDILVLDMVPPEFTCA